MKEIGPCLDGTVRTEAGDAGCALSCGLMCKLRQMPPAQRNSRPVPVTDFAGQIDGKGYKTSMDDPSKLPLWLVPVAFIRALARALQYGARKYASNNWRKGMNYSEPYSAMLRHLTAWNEGEALDPESGLSHLDHACANLAFLCEYEAHPELYAQFDNRFIRPRKEGAC